MSTSTQLADNRAHQHENRWLILLVIALAQLMVVLDATIVNIALPSAQEDLGFANDERQWIVTAYALAFGSLLLLGGKIGDIFGRKWAFIAGLIGFAVASAIGGFADSFGVLVASRALQGAFGALLAPAALSTLTNTFQNPAERGRAFGVFGAVAGGGGAVGLLLGGGLTEYTSWRWCFFVNLIFAAIAVVGAYVLLRNEAHPRPKLDLIGSLTATSGLFLLVFGLFRTETDGWGDTGTLACLIAGLVLIVAFIVIESRTEQPLLPLRIVLDRKRGGAFLAMGLTAVVLYGVFLFLTYYLQLTKGFSPFESGLAFLPMMVFVLAGSITSNLKLLPIFGARRIISFAMVLGAVGMFFLSRITVESSYATHVLPILPILGVGFGMIFSTSFNTATVGVARTEAGVASATVNTMQQVGAAIGTALMSTIAAHATTGYLTDHPGEANLTAGAVHGYATAFLVSSGIFVVGAIAIFLLITAHVAAMPAPVADETTPAPAEAR